MKKCNIILCLLLCIVFFQGNTTVLFYVHIGNKTYTIVEPSGFLFSEGRSKFTGGKSVGERAKQMQCEDDLFKVFPELKYEFLKIEKQINCEPFEGNVKFNPNANEMFSVGIQTNGKKLDTKKLQSDIYKAFKNNKKDVYASVVEIKPKRTPQQILNGIGLRSKFSTSFNGSKPERISNITLSLSKFNGKIIPPQATLSFNETTGQRTLSAGYKEANIILDGDFVPSVGGGVCQTSTTLYNACLRAGLEVSESHQHSLPISYVPLGLDAMVNGDYRDLKVLNNTDSPVFIKTYIEGSKAVVEIYGSKLGGKSYKPRTVKDPENSLRVTSFLDTYRNGEIISSKKLRRSTYKEREQEERIAKEIVSM